MYLLFISRQGAIFDTSPIPVHKNEPHAPALFLYFYFLEIGVLFLSFPQLAPGWSHADLTSGKRERPLSPGGQFETGRWTRSSLASNNCELLPPALLLKTDSTLIRFDFFCNSSGRSSEQLERCYLSECNWSLILVHWFSEVWNVIEYVFHHDFFFLEHVG